MTIRSDMKRYMIALAFGLVITGCNAQSGTAEQAGAGAVATGQSASQTTGAKEIVMYKSPGCECCTKWADHMREAGYRVVEHKRDDMNVFKSEHGVTERLASCHTALIDGYVIEGHVPSSDVDRLLKERPKVVGLTAPGMPMKSPGMQAKGLPPKGYDVLAFDQQGEAKVFNHY